MKAIVSFAQFDGTNPSISMNNDMGGSGIGKAELVCCREAVHENSNLIAPRDGVDDRCVIGGGDSSGEAVHCGHVIDSAINAPNGVGLGESLERLVHAGAGTEVEKVHRSPYEEWFLSTHPVEDPGLEIEGGAAMGSGLSDICVHRADNICPNTVNTFRTDSHAVRYPFTSGAP